MIKVVYVLVCGQKDNYYEQFLLSLCSLRFHDPGRDVEVVTDPSSYTYVKGKNERLLDGVVFTVVDAPGGDDTLYKSRYLKTSLKPIVEGDFLFLDTDTLVCGKLESIDGVRADVAAAISMNGQNKLLNDRKKMFLEQAGFGNFTEGPYYNSGVMLVRDTDTSRRLFGSWHAGWRRSFEKGVPFDQPALYVADREEGFIIKELPPVWNCLVSKDAGPHYFRKALIIHWISNNSRFNDTLIQPHIKDAGGRPDAVAMEIARNPNSDLSLFRPEGRSLFRDKLYSELLFALRRFPRAYIFVEKLRKRL